MSAEPNVQSDRTADPALPPTDINAKANTSNMPVAPELPGSEKGGNNAKHINLPNIPTDLKSILNTTDDTIVRLNTLLKTPGGLATFLSTTNYGLYILAHLHATSPSRAQILTKLATALGRTPPKSALATPVPQAVGAPATPILPLALTLADLRTTLRLTGLIPLYVLLKSLIRSTEPDRITYVIKLVQCLGYMTFQLLENVAHLTNKTIINSNWTNSRFSRLGGQAKLVTWSCRGWLTGITCDLLRLARETQLARRDGSAYTKKNEEEKLEADKQFYTSLFVALSWYPMAIHYSVEGGIGLNLGMVGACGFFANLGNFLKAWQATKQ